MQAAQVATEPIPLARQYQKNGSACSWGITVPSGTRVLPARQRFDWVELYLTNFCDKYGINIKSVKTVFVSASDVIFAVSDDFASVHQIKSENYSTISRPNHDAGTFRQIARRLVLMTHRASRTS